ncbi:MAG TPA: hypothetical protein VF235_01255 [Actinomycetota bacterium]
MTERPEELAREVEELRAERDRLRAEVEATEAGSGGSRLRRVGIVALIVLSILSLSAAMPGAWGRRTLLNTDRYVATVAPLASDPAVQEALARKVTDAVFEALDVEGRIDGLIEDRAPQLGFIVGPITEGLYDFVQSKVQEVFASEAFASFWTEANRLVHGAAIAALEGDDEGALTIQDGKVVFNYLPLVNEVLQGISSTASDLIGKPVSFPEITADTVPAEAIATIEVATGVDLPDTFGSVVVYDSDELAAAQQAFRQFNRLIYLVVFLFVVSAAAALWLSRNRRRTLLQLLVAWAVILVVERRLAIAGVGQLVEQARPENQGAVQAIGDTLLGSLLRYTGWLLAATLVALAVTLLTGPYRWAVAVRGGLVDVGRAIGGMARGTSGEGAVAWIGAHRDALMLVGAVVGVGILLLLDLSLGWFFVLVALLAGFEAFVWRTGAVVPTSTGTPGDEA